MARPRSALVLSFALALPLVMAGCDDDPAPLRSITVSGPVENRSGAALPEDARVIIAWALDDSTYVWGGGTISADGSAFSVGLDSPPPEQALMLGAVGIGFIAAITGEAPAEGEPLDPDVHGGVIGVAGDHAIIYVADRDAIPEGALWWLENVPDGYSVGIGVEREGELFDGFETVNPGSVDLIIDDLSNIDIVNWS